MTSLRGPACPRARSRSRSTTGPASPRTPAPASSPSAAEMGWAPSTRARALSHVTRLCARPRAHPRSCPARDRPLLPGLHRRRRDRAVRARAGARAAGRRRRPEQRGGRYARLARSGRVDGVFLTDLRLDDPRSRCASSSACPPSRIGRPDQPSPFPAVCLDDRAGVVAAVRHLAELGHERIAHVAGRQSLVHGARRRHAWESAMRELGLEPELLEVADFTAAGGVAATRALLNRADPPTAIVYANDVMAIAGLAVAQDPGLSLPDQLSIVGYDDSELAAHVHPSLTSVRSDAVGWGRTATRVLLDSLDGPQSDVELAPASLVVRASTAGPPITLATGRSHEPHRHQPVPAVRPRRRRAAEEAARRTPTRPPPPRARSRSGTRTTRRRWPGARRRSRRGTPRTRRRRSPGRRSRPARPPRRSSAPSITAGNAPCLIFNTSPAAVPQFQKQGGLVALDSFPDGKAYVEERSGDAAHAVPVRGRQVLPAALEGEPGDDLLQPEAVQEGRDRRRQPAARDL